MWNRLIDTRILVVPLKVIFRVILLRFPTFIRDSIFNFEFGNLLFIFCFDGSIFTFGMGSEEPWMHEIFHSFHYHQNELKGASERRERRCWFHPWGKARYCYIFSWFYYFGVEFFEENVDIKYPTLENVQRIWIIPETFPKNSFLR